MDEKRIILVDGNRPYMTSLKFILEKNGYSVASMPLQSLRDDAGEERIIVIDCQVTDMDVLRRRGNGDIFRKSDRVLILTEYECRDYGDIFKNCQRLIVLMKPFLEKDFLKMLVKMDVIDMIIEKKMKKLEEKMTKLDDKLKQLDESLSQIDEERVAGIESRIHRRIKEAMSRISIEDDEDKNI